MKLDIDRQEWGRSEIEISGSLSLEMGEDRPKSVQLEGFLTVDNLENRFLLNGDLKATGETKCGRCLEAFTFVWDVPVEIMVLRNQDSNEGQDDSLVLHQSRGEVDLSEALIECVVLASPLATVCRDDCKGLCPSCGIDRNKQSCSCKDDDFDPRWAALDNL